MVIYSKRIFCKYHMLSTEYEDEPFEDEEEDERPEDIYQDEYDE